MKMLTLFSSGLILSCTSICAAKPSRKSVDKAMGTLTYAIAKKNPQLLLTLISRSKGFRAYNTLWERPRLDKVVTYSDLTNDFKNKGMQYNLFFVGMQPGDPPWVSMYDVVKGGKGKKWVQLKPNQFHPPVVKDWVRKQQIFVRWTKEGNRWVISAIGSPES